MYQQMVWKPKELWCKKHPSAKQWLQFKGTRRRAQIAVKSLFEVGHVTNASIVVNHKAAHN
jgi:hypothetical protein